MRIGVYTDPHITRKINYLPDRTQNIVDTLRDMYGIFSRHNVSKVVCCGDFFDKARILSSDMKLVSTVMEVLENSGLETVVLSGNHDFGDSKDSIADILNILPNVRTVSKFDCERIQGVDLIYVPYGCTLAEESVSGRNIVFSHEEYAGMIINTLGTKSRSTKTIDKYNGRLVVNGHIHRFSQDTGFLNLGTCIPTKFGELESGSLPCVAIIDTDNLKYILEPLTEPYRFYILSDITSAVDLQSQVSKIHSGEQCKCCIRIDHTCDTEELSTVDLSRFKYVSYRKMIPESSSLETQNVSITGSAQKVDVVPFIETRVNGDTELSETSKSLVLREVMNTLIGEV